MTCNTSFQRALTSFPRTRDFCKTLSLDARGGHKNLPLSKGELKGVQASIWHPLRTALRSFAPPLHFAVDQMPTGNITKCS